MTFVVDWLIWFKNQLSIYLEKALVDYLLYKTGQERADLNGFQTSLLSVLTSYKAVNSVT